MSYRLLGESCKPQTMACTSNHKFLPLNASIYKKQFTYMMKYPGTTITSTLENHAIPSRVIYEQPKVLKSYYGKKMGT
jgi:hypothetical protein